MHINSSYELPTIYWFVIYDYAKLPFQCMDVRGKWTFDLFSTNWVENISCGKYVTDAIWNFVLFLCVKIKCSDEWFKCSNFCQINIVCGLSLSKQRREWTVDQEWKVSCNILSFELSRYRSIALLISFYRKSHENFKCGLFVCGQIRYNYFFTQLLA